MSGTRAAAGVVVAGVLLAACAPGTPDVDSWRVDAQRSLADAASALGAAELALEQHDEGRVFDAYLQTVLVDSEKAVGAAGDSIGSEQPPGPERERYDAVTGQLDAAADLVSTARIAVVDGEADRYDALADRLEDAATALQQLESDLGHPAAG